MQSKRRPPATFCPLDLSPDAFSNDPFFNSTNHRDSWTEDRHDFELFAPRDMMSDIATGSSEDWCGRFTLVMCGSAVQTKNLGSGICTSAGVAAPHEGVWSEIYTVAAGSGGVDKASCDFPVGMREVACWQRQLTFGTFQAYLTPATHHFPYRFRTEVWLYRGGGRAV